MKKVSIVLAIVGFVIALPVLAAEMKEWVFVEKDPEMVVEEASTYLNQAKKGLVQADLKIIDRHIANLEQLREALFLRLRRIDPIKYISSAIQEAERKAGIEPKSAYAALAPLDVSQTSPWDDRALSCIKREKL